MSRRTIRAVLIALCILSLAPEETSNRLGADQSEVRFPIDVYRGARVSLHPPGPGLPCRLPGHEHGCGAAPIASLLRRRPLHHPGRGDHRPRGQVSGLPARGQPGADDPAGAVRSDPGRSGKPERRRALLGDSHVPGVSTDHPGNEIVLRKCHGMLHRSRWRRRAV